jgi:hypothetical protein
MKYVERSEGVRKVTEQMTQDPIRSNEDVALVQYESHGSDVTLEVVKRGDNGETINNDM